MIKLVLPYQRSTDTPSRSNAVLLKYSSKKNAAKRSFHVSQRRLKNGEMVNVKLRISLRINVILSTLMIIP